MKFRFLLLGPEDDPANPVPVTGIAGGSAAGSRFPLYQVQGPNLVRRVRSADGEWKSMIIANFHARIMEDLLVDDGSTPLERRFVIRAVVGDQTVVFELSAAEFTAMRWVLPQLGPQAIVYPGQQQQVRAAIQQLSEGVRSQHLFAYVGWRQFESQWGYLHGGGVLGPVSCARSCRVRLEAPLRSYQMAVAPDETARRAAVRASLHLLHAAPDRVSLPLLAAVYRAALGDSNFSLFLNGPSGVFKSSLAAICQQHYGSTMDAHHLPANFASTSNALEWMAYAVKDAILVVDDFALTEGPGDRELGAVAERLFRSAGNHQGRHRLRAAGQLGAGCAPRALLLATGEEIPRGASLRARLLVVDVGAGVVRAPVLSDCQCAGRDGRLAAAMATFLNWVAERYRDLQNQHRRRVVELRDQQSHAGRHARTPAAVAELQSGWEIFLQFALQVGGITEAEQQVLLQRGVCALAELAVRQGAYQQPADPAFRFLALLQTALAEAKAHVANRHGGAPPEAARWGWRQSGRTSSPQGVCIGWVVGHDLYLDPVLSYELAQQQAGTTRLAVSPQQLRQSLNQRGLLASRDIGRHMLQIRRNLAGRPRKVIHLDTGALLP